MGARWGAPLLLLTVLLGCCIRTDAVPGALRIATCQETYAPFVQLTPDGTFYGFEISQWQMIYELLISRAAISGDPDLQFWVGDQMSPLIAANIFDPTSALAMLDAGDADIAFCGYYRTPDRANIVDLSPRTKSSGYAIVISATPVSISTSRLLAASFPLPGPVATFAMLLLLCLSVVYAHLVWYVERRGNLDIAESYGAGVFDSWWMSMVIAVSVGYGDKVPRTAIGRVLTVTWIFTAVYFLAIFAASLTSDLVFVQAASESYTSPIQAPTDLEGLTVGSYFTKAQDAMSQAAPSVDRLQMYTTVDNVYWQLLNGEIDAVIDDYTAAQYRVRLPAFKGQIMITGDLFNPIDYGIFIGRPNGTSHPVYAQLVRAVYDYYQGVYKLRRLANEQRWLADSTADYLREGQARVLNSSVMDVNGRFLGALFAIVFAAFLVSWVHYKNLRRNLHERSLLLRQLGCAKRQDRYMIRKGADRLFELWDSNKDGSLSLREIILGLKNLGFMEGGLQEQILREAHVAGTHMREVDGEVLVSREDFHWIVRLFVYEGFSGDGTKQVEAAKPANAADVMTLLDDFMVLTRDIRRRMKLMEWRLQRDPTVPPPAASVPVTPQLYPRVAPPRSLSLKRQASGGRVPSMGGVSPRVPSVMSAIGALSSLAQRPSQPSTGFALRRDQPVMSRRSAQFDDLSGEQYPEYPEEEERDSRAGDRAVAALREGLRNIFR